MKREWIVIVAILTVTSLGSAKPLRFSADSLSDTQAKQQDSMIQRPVLWGLGLSLGTPAGINLILQGTSGRYLGRVAGMVVPSLAGVQLEYGYLISQTQKTNFVISGVFSASDLHSSAYLGGSSHLTWMGVGIAASTYLSGFFLQGGLTWGNGSMESTETDWFRGSKHTYTTVSSPQLIAQIGYIYEFGP